VIRYFMSFLSCFSILAANGTDGPNNQTQRQIVQEWNTRSNDSIAIRISVTENLIYNDGIYGNPYSKYSHDFGFYGIQGMTHNLAREALCFG